MSTERRTITATAPVILRVGREEDTPALRRLACLDSALPLGGDVLLAVRGDEIAAAISLHSGRVVADPFQPTGDLVALLRARLALLRGAGSPGGRGVARRLLRSAA